MQVLTRETVECHFPFKHLRELSLKSCKHVSASILDLVIGDSKACLYDLSLTDTDMHRSIVTLGKYSNLRRVVLDDTVITDAGVNQVPYEIECGCRIV